MARTASQLANFKCILFKEKQMSPTSQTHLFMDKYVSHLFFIVKGKTLYTLLSNIHMFLITKIISLMILQWPKVILSLSCFLSSFTYSFYLEITFNEKIVYTVKQ